MLAMAFDRFRRARGSCGRELCVKGDIYFVGVYERADGRHSRGVDETHTLLDEVSLHVFPERLPVRLA